MAILIGAAVVASGSHQDPSRSADSTRMVDSGSWYSRVQWPHDGHPYESRHFVVYGAAASQEARRAVAEIGEELLAELIAEFGIAGDGMLRFPPGQDKIHIYVYRNRNPWWGARAYYCGLVIWSLEHETRSHDLEFYRAVMKHEMVHVVEALLKGRDVAFFPVAVRVHVWFSEGLAEAVTGGTAGRAIRDLDYLNHLTGKYGRLSPIAFESDGQVGDWDEEETAVACCEYHYPMYQLAVEYLLDPRGYGKSLQDVVLVFTDIADGSDFTTAFETRMGIELADYEEQFFDLMNGYLEPGISTRLRRAIVVWLALVAASLIVLVRGFARGTVKRRRTMWAWSFATLLLGPLGLLGHRLSRPRAGRPAAIWRYALGPSMFSVTGDLALLVFVVACFAIFQPRGDLDPLDPLLPFLAGWLIVRALLAAARHRGVYQVAFRRSLATDFIPMILALAGALAVLVPLHGHWWFSLDPGSLFFWGGIAAAAIAGVVIVYPYKAWALRFRWKRLPG